MKNFHNKYFYLIALLPLALIFIACSQKGIIPDDDDIGPGQGGAEVTQADIYFNITVAIPSDIHYDNSRASLAQTYDFRGNLVDESAINNLTVFVVNYDPVTDNDDWAVCDYRTLSIDENNLTHNDDGNSSSVRLTFSIRVPRHPKHVYVAANLSQELIDECASSGVFRASASDDYYTIVRRFIDEDNGAVAMFSTDRAVVLDDDDSDSSSEKPYTSSFKLAPMLAKVLLTCDMEDDTHIKVKSNIDEKYADNFKGWIKLASVRFKLGTTNRTTYFYQHKDDYGNVVDPNYYVADQLTLDARNNDWIYANGYANDFSYSANIDGDFYPEYKENVVYLDPSTANCMTALKYEDSRMPTNDNKDIRYKQGLYCLENTCDNNWSAIPGYDSFLATRSNWFIGPRKIATGIDIETRYIPAVIVGENCISKREGYKNNDNLSMAERLNSLLNINPYCFADDDLPLRRQPEAFSTGNAEDAAKNFIVSESINPEDDLATYYSLYIGNTYYFFTYRAVQQLIAIANQNGLNGYFTSDLTPFKTYPNGLIYYHTYINHIADQNPDQAITGITRNNYYILRCAYMSVPSLLSTPQTKTYARQIW